MNPLICIAIGIGSMFYGINELLKDEKKAPNSDLTIEDESPIKATPQAISVPLNETDNQINSDSDSSINGSVADS